jgi:hypothetical protein
VSKRQQIDKAKSWHKKVRLLDRAEGYVRNRLLKSLAYEAGLLIASRELFEKQAIGCLTAACRVNRLAGAKKSEYVSSGTGYVLGIINKHIEKGAKTSVAEFNTNVF